MEQQRRSTQPVSSETTPAGHNRLLGNWPEFSKMSPERRKSFSEARARILPRLGDMAFVEAVADQGLNGE
jgi:hypothetical protein